MFCSDCDSCESTTLLGRLERFANSYNVKLNKGAICENSTLRLMEKMEDKYGICVCPSIAIISNPSLLEILDKRCPCFEGYLEALSKGSCKYGLFEKR